MLNPHVLLCASAAWSELAGVLRDAGYRVTHLPADGDLLTAVRGLRPDVVLVDAADPSGLPGTEVLATVREVRSAVQGALLVAVAPDDEVAGLLAFAAGADDVVSLATPRLLVVRLGVVLRRSLTAREPARALAVGPFELDDDTRIASCEGEVLPLTRIEFDLLAVLLEEPRRVVPREELVSRVWGSWYGDDHMVEVHMSRLRAKVLRAGGPRIGAAVRGVGYRLGLPTAIAV